ncbi:MAG: hypothetical protein V3S09_06610 [Candidatus Bathyarchaeia archaeon]
MTPSTFSVPGRVPRVSLIPVSVSRVSSLIPSLMGPVAGRAKPP